MGPEDVGLLVVLVIGVFLLIAVAGILPGRGQTHNQRQAMNDLLVFYPADSLGPPEESESTGQRTAADTGDTPS